MIKSYPNKDCGVEECPRQNKTWKKSGSFQELKKFCVATAQGGKGRKCAARRQEKSCARPRRSGKNFGFTLSVEKGTEVC